MRIVDGTLAEGTQPLSVVPHTLVVDGSCPGDKQQYILIPPGEDSNSGLMNQDATMIVISSLEQQWPHM